MSLRAVRGLQVTISVYADKGLLDKSTVVRIRLRRPPTPDTAVSDRPPLGLNQPVPFDALLEFPSEDALPGDSLRAPAYHSRSMLRVSTFIAFAAGVAVGASSGRLGVSMPSLLTAKAPRPPAHQTLASTHAPTPPQGTRPTQRAGVAAVAALDGMPRSPLLEEPPNAPGGYLNTQPVGSTPLGLFGMAVGSQTFLPDLPGSEQGSLPMTLSTTQAARITFDETYALRGAPLR